ncbi:MAG: hypothetical protein DLM65_01370 [Candidatus Aeolococcus gillhamiae]|uniref:Uncharacterized protein n=1 Tax=Candidatus Aeolococcus gillhamiae TaxID=3127015 RepID=A0A2W5ZKU9_9BACT|nr:MAG: hypothetical protein DLM65_01370 [Candidatus Dormibacter sp. RRmetagenome_bin12]
MGHRLLRSLLTWLPFAVVITFAAGVAYGLDQQNLRSAANDPQIQLAEDAGARLDAGAPASSVVPTSSVPVDIARSLAPFVIVYDAGDKPLASSGRLDGAVPVPPQGVSASARVAEDRVTWQPRNGVRIAAVVVAFNGGTVLAGRSLRVVEQRADDALAVTATLWLGALVLTWLVIVGSRLVAERHASRRPPSAVP